MAEKLGSILVRKELITPEQLEEALKLQVIYGGRIGTNLVELNYIDIDTLSQCLAEQTRIPAATIAELEATTQGTLDLLSPQLAEKHLAFPLRVEGRRFVVAMASAFDVAAVDDLGFSTGYRIVPRICPELRILYYLEKRYGIRREQRYIRLSEDPVRGQAKKPGAAAGGKLDRRALLAQAAANPAPAAPASSSEFSPLGAGQYLTSDEDDLYVNSGGSLGGSARASAAPAPAAPPSPSAARRAALGLGAPAASPAPAPRPEPAQPVLAAPAPAAAPSPSASRRAALGLGAPATPALTPQPSPALTLAQPQPAPRPSAPAARQSPQPPVPAASASAARRAALGLAASAPAPTPASHNPLPFEIETGPAAPRPASPAAPVQRLPSTPPAAVATPASPAPRVTPQPSPAAPPPAAASAPLAQPAPPAPPPAAPPARPAPPPTITPPAPIPSPAAAGADELSTMTWDLALEAPAPAAPPPAPAAAVEAAPKAPWAIPAPEPAPAPAAQAQTAAAQASAPAEAAAAARPEDQLPGELEQEPVTSGLFAIPEPPPDADAPREPEPEYRPAPGMMLVEELLGRASDREKIGEGIVWFCEGRFTSGLLFAVAPSGELVEGWHCTDDSLDMKSFARLAVPLDQASYFRGAIDSRKPTVFEAPQSGVDRRLLAWAKLHPRSSVVATPIVVRERVVNVLIGTRGTWPLRENIVDELERLAHTASRAYERLLLVRKSID